METQPIKSRVCIATPSNSKTNQSKPMPWSLPVRNACIAGSLNCCKICNSSFYEYHLRDYQPFISSISFSFLSKTLVHISQFPQSCISISYLMINGFFRSIASNQMIMHPLTKIVTRSLLSPNSLL